MIPSPKILPAKIEIRGMEFLSEEYETSQEDANINQSGKAFL